jgi:hypothetical protein
MEHLLTELAIAGYLDDEALSFVVSVSARLEQANKNKIATFV